LSLQAEPDGRLPWTEFTTNPVEEGDWITLTLGSQQAGFPIVLLQATGDSVRNTIEGNARPFAKVAAMVGQAGEWFWLETNAEADGHFVIDFSSRVDWDVGDYLKVGQYLTGNGLVDVTAGSPHFDILPLPTPTPTCTPSHDAPPFIYISGPTEARVGDEIILDASDTWDIDGDPFTLKWAQCHNPDRYTGTEYVTDNDVLIESLDGSQSVTYPNSLTGVAQLRFVPEWPGNYRFELVASDIDGESRQLTDVCVTLAEPLDWEFRGASSGLYALGLHNARSSEIQGLFQQLSALGVDYFEIGTPWFMYGVDSSALGAIYDSEDLPPHRGDFSYITPTLRDEQLIAAIRSSHEHGLKVYLRPGVEVITLDGWAFRGSIQPSDLARWWDSYRTFLAHYARMARDYGVEMFGIGFELDSMVNHTEEWNRTIELVRCIFPGLISYDTTSPRYNGPQGSYDAQDPQKWSSPPCGEFAHNLDRLGIDWYPQISDRSDAPLSELHANIDGIVRNVLVPLHQHYGKPIHFGEINYPSVDGMAMDPLFRREGEVDLEEQARAHEAFFCAFADEELFAGPFLNIYYFGRVGSGTIDPINSGDDLAGKPAEQVVKLWFVQ